MPTILKNNGDSEYTLHHLGKGVAINAGASQNLELTWHPAQLASCHQLLDDLGVQALALVLNDGEQDLSLSRAAHHLLRLPPLHETDDNGHPYFTMRSVSRDGRHKVVQCPMPPDTMPLWQGAMDDIENGIPAGGDRIILSLAGPGEIYKLIDLVGPQVHMFDGEIFWTPPSNWTVQDWWEFFVYIRQNSQPSRADRDAPCVAAPGGDGNANVVDTGMGFSMIIPAPLNDGAYQVDLSIARPIGVGEGNPMAYWSSEVDEYVDPTITPAMGPEGQALGNTALLFDIDGRLYIMDKMPCGSSLGHFLLDATQSQPLHHTWQLVLGVHKSSDLPGALGLWFKPFREANMRFDCANLPIPEAPE
jgi:hypothetical protein